MAEALASRRVRPGRRVVMMTGVEPTFSIVMMSYNYGRYIAAAIESVLAQDFERWELLVVDDCSSDDSWDVIQQFKDPRIKAQRLSFNQGASTAYNHAFARASGRYIACLDSDDFFLPGKLSRQAEFLMQHPDVDVCGSYVIEVDTDGLEVTGKRPFADWFNVDVDLNDPARWLWENRLCHSGSVIRSTVHRTIGGLAKELTFTPDWQFWIRALIAGARFQVIPEPLVAYRNHDHNITHKQPAIALREHAATLVTHFIPWLEGSGKSDAIDQALSGLVGRLALLDGQEPFAEIADTLFAAGSVASMGSAALRLLVRFRRLEHARQRDRADPDSDWGKLQRDLEQLTVSSQWHAQQSQAWQSRAEESDRAMVEMRQRLLDTEAALGDVRAQLNELSRHWAMRITRFVTGLRRRQR